MVTTIMKSEDAFFDEAYWNELAQELTAKIHGTVQRNEPMARHTTFRVGGPAELFLAPDDERDLLVVLHVLAQAGCSLTIIGNGSNLLVSDRASAAPCCA